MRSDPTPSADPPASADSWVGAVTTRAVIAACSAVGAFEAFLVVNELAFPSEQLSKLFAGIFIAHLYLRIRWRKDPDAQRLWWPVEWTVFACYLWERWLHRPRGHFLKTVVIDPLKAAITGNIIRIVLSNPVEAYRRLQQALRWARWVVWIIPIFQSLKKLQGAFQR